MKGRAVSIVAMGHHLGIVDCVTGDLLYSRPITAGCREDIKREIRANLYNVTNHTNFPWANFKQYYISDDQYFALIHAFSEEEAIEIYFSHNPSRKGKGKDFHVS